MAGCSIVLEERYPVRPVRPRKKVLKSKHSQEKIGEKKESEENQRERDEVENQLRAETVLRGRQ